MWGLGIFKNGFFSVIFITLISVLASLAHADSRRLVEYVYDQAGNIVRIKSDVSENPPVISNVNPSFIRIGPAVNVVVTGTDLKRVEVTTDSAELIVSNVSSESTVVTFDLKASNNAALGTHTLTFTTNLGSGTADIIVQPRLPVLFVSPTPVLLSNSGAPLTLNIELSSADFIPITLNLTTANSSTATVSPSSITFALGETTTTEVVQVVGVSLGMTALNITSTILDNLSANIFVTDLYEPPIGDNAAHALLLGVVLTPEPDPPELITRGPFASELSIIKESSSVPVTTNVTPIVSANMGIILGSGVIDMNPKTLIQDTGPIDITVSGIGLANVTSVEIIPSEGLSLGSLLVSPNGTSVTVPISIAVDAVLGFRSLRLLAGSTVIQPASLEITQLLIAPEAPIVESLSPILLEQNQTAPLIIRGENFQNIQSINITPAEGIIIGTATINANATQINVAVSAASDAVVGPRTVVVTTSAGMSDESATAANTLSIVEGPVKNIQPIMAPLLGVQVGEANEPSAATIGKIRANHLGIAFGSTITGLTPGTGAIGSNITLTIQGNDLQAVSDVQFIPDDGLTLGIPVVAGDGQSVTMDIGIAIDAAQTLRAVSVLAGSSVLSGSSANATRFLVTAQQPVLSLVSPINIVRGAGSSSFTLQGFNFNNTQEVRVIPADDISVSPPLVSANGSTITVTLSANSSAVTGPRVVVVQTPAGETTSNGDETNTLNVVNEIVQTVTPIIAPLLGINKTEGSGGSTTTVPRLITAPLLGIELEQTPPAVSSNIPLNAAHVGVALGTFAKNISPTAIPIDTTANLIIEGVALDNVTSISIVPDNGVTQTGALVISGDGSQVTVPLAIDALAAQTLRAITLNTATGSIPFSDASANRLQISDSSPVIISVWPIQEIVDTTVNLIIRGVNLSNVISIDATPADGIIFGTPTEAASGTQITVQMNISATATPGPRVITVTTVAETTSSAPVAANTFTVVLE